MEHMDARGNLEDTNNCMDGTSIASDQRSDIQPVQVVTEETPKKHSGKQYYAIIVAFALLILGATIIAVVIVCLKVHKPGYECQPLFTAVLNGDVFQHDSHPSWAAIGDLNHDHYPDIVVANYGTNSIGIFVNNVNGTFAPQLTINTGDRSRPLFVLLSDFDNDTHLDIAVANHDTHTIVIYLGHGNGTFSNNRTLFTTASRPLSMATGDFNRDHITDLAVANNGTNDISIYFGNGDGTFAHQLRLPTGHDALPHFVAIADLNDDECPDVIVANAGTDCIGVFLGHGDGSFSGQESFFISPRAHPRSLAVQDFNGDGHLDVVTTNFDSRSVELFLGSGNGTFTKQKSSALSADSVPYSLVAGDIDRDGHVDVAVVSSVSNSIDVLIGFGNGSFATATTHSTGIDASPVGIAIGDFDRDNQSDIAVANYRNNDVFVLIEYQIVQSDQPTTYSTGAGSQTYAIGSADLNKDTHIDLVSANMGANNIGIFLGNGDGTFQEQIAYPSGDSTRPFGLFIADIDGDGHLDIVVANSNGESVGILYGHGDGTFEAVVRYFTGSGSSLESVVVADFNNDHRLDIAAADYGTNNAVILLGRGDRNFTTFAKYSAGLGSRPYSITAADLNGDGNVDLATANYGNNAVAILLGTSNGSFVLFAELPTGDASNPWMLTTADLNKDNHTDIIVVNHGTSVVDIFYGFGNGSFKSQESYSSGATSAAVWTCIIDMNNDTWLDIVIVNTNTNDAGIFLADGHGGFGSQATYPLGFGAAPSAVTVGDFNEDNRPDVATANYGSSSVSVLLAQPTSDVANKSSMQPIRLGDYFAQFRSRTGYPTGSSSHPFSVAVGHLDNDTIKDIVIANSGTESLSILLGNTNNSYVMTTTRSTGAGSAPQQSVIGDFNKDSHSDIAVIDSKGSSLLLLFGSGDGSFPSEIRYSTGAGSRPSSLAKADLNADGFADLIVANSGADNFGVFFGFDYTSFDKQMPIDTGMSSNPFGTSTADLNHDGHLDVVCAFHGANNIGVFLGRGDGTFAPVRTYGTLPASRPYCVAFGDFNNDTHLDIIAANWGADSFSVLMGFGDGSFADAMTYPTAGTRPMYVTVGDVNNDKRLDIISANYGGDNLDVYLGFGNGSFRSGGVLLTGVGSTPTAVTTADLNNDGNLDIIATNQAGFSIGVFLGYGNGSFAQQVTFDTGAESSPWNSRVADFNKDGYADVVVVAYAARGIVVLYGYGNGSLGRAHAYTSGADSMPVGIQIGDFNNDSQLDIAVSDETDGKVGVFFGYKDGTFASVSVMSLELGTVSYGLTVGDYDEDGRMDIVATDILNNYLIVYLARGSRPFGGQTTFATGEGSRPSFATVGHFNDDAHLDVATANAGTHSVSIFLGDGNRHLSLAAAHSIGEGSWPVSLAVGDFNNDSRTDMVVANFEADDILILIGNGDGTFATLARYSMGANSQPTSVGLGDFNRDRHLDIGVSNSGTNDVHTLYGVGNGTFANETSYPLGYDSRPNFLVFEDLNDDRLVDIAVALYGVDNVMVVLNVC